MSSENPADSIFPTTILKRYAGASIPSRLIIITALLKSTGGW
jgi:hypothetical protein